MQAIARVNRVFRDKPAGLVVDYIGIAQNLKSALNQYSADDQRQAGIDEAEAIAESPALLRPVEDVRLTCWAGAAERAEFVRQNALLANVWIGLGARTSKAEEPNRHHFNIIDGLTDPEHPLTRTLLFG
jgi:hypothetical protein